jgi:hypothetical protein
MKTKNNWLPLLFCAALLASSLPSSNVQSKAIGNAVKEVYTGTMFYFDGTFGPGAGLRRGNRSGSGTEFFTLTINSYTPENEVARMLGALRQDGQDGLMKTLNKDKVGTLQIGNGLARDVQAVWITQTDEGRKISALSERWLGFGELRRGARSVDYPLTYIEIFVEEDGGKSEGSLIPAARVRSKGGNNIEIENFGIYPARLTNIKVGRK